MIPARTARLIVRSVSTALVVAVMAVLVVIYLRSEGKVANSLAAARPSGTSTGTGGEKGSGSSAASGGTGGSEGSTSGTCEPPRVCTAGSQTSTGKSSTTHASTAKATYTGSVAENPYGPVQVSVTEEGGKIVEIKALQMPTEHALSQEISEHVAPMLRSEALQAQSAEINLISGATYTSEGYAQSLQAALHQAG